MPLDIRYPGILKKVRPVTSRNYLRNLLESYLDERAKSDHLPEHIARHLVPSDRYAAAVKDKRVPLRAGEDYLPAGSPGLKYYGFIRQVLMTKFPDPDAADPGEVVRVLREWWLAETEGRTRRAYHLITSMHPDLAAALTKAGYSADAALLSATSRAFETYVARFFPGDEVGYVAGVHHDKPHPHVHVLLFPKTMNGSRLRLSRLAPVKGPDGEVHRVDYQGALQQAFYDETKKYLDLVNQLEAGAPVSTKDVRDKVLQAEAAVEAALNAAGEQAPPPEAFVEQRRETATKGDIFFREVRHGLIHGIMAKDKPDDQLTEVSRGFARLRADLLGSRDARKAAFAEAIRARTAAVSGVYDFEMLPHRVGYSPKSASDFGLPSATPEATLATLHERRCAQIAARQAALEKLKASYPGAVGGTAGIAIRSYYNANILACYLGQASGQIPAHLRDEPGLNEAATESPDDARRALAANVAALMASRSYKLRPFTMAEMGNRDLSPYRKPDAGDHTTDAPDDPEHDEEAENMARLLFAAVKPVSTHRPPIASPELG